MAEENPNSLSSENEIVENDELVISSTTYTGRELQIFRNNNNDHSTNNNNNTMMVSIQNLGESSQNVSVQVTSTSSTFTTRITMNSNQISTPDDYESDLDYSAIDNDDGGDTSPDSQDNSNNNATENESDIATDTASSFEEIDSTSKQLTDEDEEKVTRKRIIQSDVKPKKRFKKDNNIPDT